ncbi:MAG TPA: GGDEF domain-containing protein [Urbifossiella sp.]|jgi:diguanylate cyclase (GGDEF)-like protein|nr:GGDEF domain-containing protein [Urbifossiella sp.]
MAEKVTETWISTPKRLVSAARDACLVHIYPTGSAMGTRYPLREKPLVVGRGDDCDVRITDNSVSRRHARIDHVQDGYHVSDLGSTNGTFVNDRQLDSPVSLHDGDYLRVGNCIYRYLAGGNIEAEYHEEIYRLTIQDGLTRVHNQRALMDFLDREVARSQRHNRPLSVLMFDIDKFKGINDTHGHLCGDFVLRELAECVETTVRKEDLFARYGGEEFTLVLVETGRDEAARAAERIRSLVESRAFRFETTPIRLTISVGVATTAGDPDITPADLLKAADDRLYQAKRTGRNRVCC